MERAGQGDQSTPSPLRIRSCQFNYQYGDQLHFPYSIATLVSYLKAQPDLRGHLSFGKCFVKREDVSRLADQCLDADVLLCSCYVWNWEITNDFARMVKERNPACAVIFGGPQVPDRTEGFFEAHPYVDILAHNEGEVVLANILRRLCDREPLEGLAGISLPGQVGWLPEKRIEDINVIPSPYLTDTVWELVDREEGLKWIASWETSRGCPYHCTFCDWGSATYTKMRKFEEERLFEEIEWFAKQQIVYIDCCDSNFGIFIKRDQELARRLKEVTLKTGYPQTFRQSWAKNSSERIIPVAKELQAGGLLTAVGLAVESLDDNTLTTIKRKNIKFESFSKLTEEFENEGLPTYTEVIRGLPGETLESFKRGLETLVADSRIGTIYIYNTCVLPNAPLNDPEYRATHEIESVRSPIYLAHSSIHSRDVPEYEEIVTATKTFTLDELKEMFLYSWCVLTFQNLGILEHVAEFFHQRYQTPFMTFYERFLKFCREEDSLFGREFEIVVAYMNDGYAGQGWDHHDERLGPIFWPIESATWLRLTEDKPALEESMNRFCRVLAAELQLEIASELLSDLCKFQCFVLSDRNSTGSHQEECFDHNWPAWLQGDPLSTESCRYQKEVLVSSEHTGFEWNKRAIWWGRRALKFKTLAQNLVRVDADGSRTAA